MDHEAYLHFSEFQFLGQIDSFSADEILVFMKSFFESFQLRGGKHRPRSLRTIQIQGSRKHQLLRRSIGTLGRDKQKLQYKVFYSIVSTMDVKCMNVNERVG